MNQLNKQALLRMSQESDEGTGNSMGHNVPEAPQANPDDLSGILTTEAIEAATQDQAASVVYEMTEDDTLWTMQDVALWALGDTAIEEYQTQNARQYNKANPIALSISHGDTFTTPDGARMFQVVSIETASVRDLTGKVTNQPVAFCRSARDVVDPLFLSEGVRNFYRLFALSARSEGSKGHPMTKAKVILLLQQHQASSTGRSAVRRPTQQALTPRTLAPAKVA